MLYLVSYDLKTPGQDYPALTALLTGLNAQRVLRSQWLVVYNSTALDLAKRVISSGGLDTNDRVLVTEVTQSTAWLNLMISTETMNQFLKHARP